jgi:hypothetical protein
MHVTTTGKNLKVLPKDLTVDQLDRVMQEWKASVGTHCMTCHGTGNMGQPGGGQGQPGGNQAQAGGGQGGPPSSGQAQAGGGQGGPPSGGQGQPGGGQMGGPQGGPPQTDFADDSNKDKIAARKMYTMVQEINKNYLAESKTLVTCGTCHRGHEKPEAFVATTTNEGPPQGGQQGGPQGMPQGAPQGQPAAPAAQK